MAIPLLPIATGILGAIAGGQGQRASGEATSQLQVAPESEQEKAFRLAQQQQFGALQGLVGVGPGQQDVEAALASQRGLATGIQGALANGGLPTAADLQSAQGFAQSIFAPQQQALNQAYTQAQTDTARLSAQLGRPINDPVLQAKLAQYQGNNVAQLQAQQGAFAAQQAQNLPFQRLQLQSQLADVQGNLASQAFSNRQAILNMGNKLAQQERQFRLQTGVQRGTSSQTQGGGLAGAISGGLAGFGTGAGLMGQFGSLFGGGGAATSVQGFGNIGNLAPAGVRRGGALDV